MTVKTNEINGKFEMYTPYNREFISEIKSIGSARWNPNKKCWSVGSEDKEAAKNVLMNAYGEDGEQAVEKVTVRIQAVKEIESLCEPVSYAGREIAAAYGRDTGAKIGNGVVLESGNATSGGNRNTWKTIIEEGSIFRVRGIPKSLIEKESDGFKVIEIMNDGIDREALKAEKEKLLKRLAEIDELLK